MQNSRKKVLIITYYWPPAGGPGVQRWLKFVKYLREFGWEPVVYTASNPSYPMIDETLISEIPEGVEVIKQPILEPYNLASIIGGKKSINKTKGGFIESEENQSTIQKLSVWVRGNLFIPDARKFWISPSVKFLQKYLSENNIDVVVSSGPPHSMHMIGLQLKNKLNIKWVADFRDPWTNIDYYSSLKLSKWADKKHHQLEKEVLNTADKVLTVSEAWKNDFFKISNKNNIHVLTNGFDNELNEDEQVLLDEKFTISHIGSMNAERNPIVFWNALKELVDINKVFANKLQIKLAGGVSDEVFEYLEKNGLKKYVVYNSYLNHKEAVRFQKSSQLLLLLTNNPKNAMGMLPGKLFEYLNANRPILAISPNGSDLSEVLKNTNGGVNIDYSDKEEMKKSVLNYFNLYSNGGLFVKSENINQYSRKSVTGKLAEVLNMV